MPDSPYPAKYPACIMCGANAGEPCTVISTAHDEFHNQTAGDRRTSPHAYRAKPGQPGPSAPFVAVKDEPNHYADQPHTPECGPDCPLGKPA